MSEKPQAVRSPGPRVGATREAEEFRRVAEIVLGRALEGRDRLAEFGTAERAKSSPAQTGQTAGVFSLIGAHMRRLTFREDADTEADAREAFEENVLAEDAERKPGEEKLAAVAAAHREKARQAAKEKGHRPKSQKRCR